MQELTTVSTSSSLTTSAQPSTTNLVQPLLTALGWKDLKPAIMAAEQADQALALELQQAYDAYSKTSDAASQQRLQRALDQTIGELQADLSRVKKLEKEAAKRLAKSQDSSSGYLANWGSWLKKSAQTFFGSDDASLVERYGEIAQKRQTEIAQLSQLREGLAVKVAAAQISVEEEPIEEVISPLSRRLLQLQTIPADQYCYPNGACDLNNLSDGLGGFVLQGEAGSDYSGYSVSGAGDVNGDGVADLVVGAQGADPSGRTNAGKSYVVFGSRNATAWDNGILELSSLCDGVRGFVLQGEASGYYSGWSVSTAGDINGDGVGDLVVGAQGASPSGRGSAGSSYVVFGSRNATAWNNGVLELSNLHDGVRGFVLQGEAVGDASGWSVSAAGDVNGDGIADLVVGAYLTSPSGRSGAGSSYVVFGSRNATAWGNGTLELSSLRDGVRGFVLQGEGASDYSGCSVSSAGDVNGDGLGDLVIGAWQASSSGRSQAGKSYVWN